MLPSLAGAAGPDSADLEHSLDLHHGSLPGVYEAIRAITDAQRAAAAGNVLAPLHELSLAVLADIAAAREQAGDAVGAGLALDLLAFTTGTGAAIMTFATSDGGRAHGWWVRSLADTYDGDGGYPIQPQRLALWRVMPGPLGPLAAEFAARWVKGFYWHSWTFAEFISWADKLFDLAADLDEPIANGWVPELVAAESLILRAQWALRYRPADAPALALSRRSTGRSQNAPPSRRSRTSSR